MNFHHSGKKVLPVRFLVPAIGAFAVTRPSRALPSVHLHTPVVTLLVLQQRACHVPHVHQREGQLALAAVLVRGGFLCGGGSAAQQGAGVFLGLFTGDTFVKGPYPVVPAGAGGVWIEGIVEGAAGRFAVEICFVVLRWFHPDTCECQ